MDQPALFWTHAGSFITTNGILNRQPPSSIDQEYYTRPTSEDLLAVHAWQLLTDRQSYTLTSFTESRFTAGQPSLPLRTDRHTRIDDSTYYHQC